MPRSLPPVLSSQDFPEAELCALRLDGEVFPLDYCACPIDEVASPKLRAAALTAALPERLIVERRSAAWVWGALLRPPTRHEVSARIGARTRPATSLPLAMREVVIEEDDLASFGSISVTTPMRTAVDLARSSIRFDTALVARLMTIGGFDARACLSVLNRRRNLPNKRVALERLQRAWGVSSQLELTLYTS